MSTANVELIVCFVPLTLKETLFSLLFPESFEQEKNKQLKHIKRHAIYFFISLIFKRLVIKIQNYLKSYLNS